MGRLYRPGLRVIYQRRRFYRAKELKPWRLDRAQVAHRTNRPMATRCAALLTLLNNASNLFTDRQAARLDEYLVGQILVQVVEDDVGEADGEAISGSVK